MKKFLLTALSVAALTTACKKTEEATTAETTTTTTEQTAPVAADSTGVSASTQTTTTTTAGTDLASWAGTYTGLVPTASSPGNNMTLTLNADGTYTIQNDYLEEKDGKSTDQGKYTVEADGKTITLNEEGNPTPMRLMKEGNALVGLNADGQKATNPETRLVKK